jgi:surface carbohydrate biosynthesis protein
MININNKKILTILQIKWEFKRIRKKSHLIIGHDNSHHILKYIPKNKAEIISFRIVNLEIIFKLFLERKKISKLNYFIKSIELTNPKIIVTMIDNDTDFYRLKKYFPHKKFISIQNGYRTEPRKTFLIKKGEKLQCDIIFCLGKQGVNYYRSLVQTKVIPIGSIKNNLISQNSIKKKRIMTFISEYRVIDKKKKVNLFNISNILWRDYIFSEKKLVKIASDYCKKRKIKFNIIGRYDNPTKELEYFSHIISKKNFDYISRKNEFTSYNFLKKSEIILSLSSSLGYEFLSRDNRMIFFSRQIGKKTSKLSKLFLFGWPFVKKKKGFFYSNEITSSEISRLGKNVIDCSKQKWLSKKYNYQKNIISFNYNNILLKKELNNTL